MVASIAQGLHLARRARSRLPTGRSQSAEQRTSSEHISPGLLRILDRLEDTPAEIVTELGETLRQTRLGIALTGDAPGAAGPAQCWGTAGSPTRRRGRRTRPTSSGPVAGLRLRAARTGHAARHRLPRGSLPTCCPRSAEFRELWTAQEVGVRPPEIKRFNHPEVGRLELSCQTLLDPDQSHRLLVYTAVPGSESYEKLQLLAVIGAQTLA